jgi:hypothetical protein
VFERTRFGRRGLDPDCLEVVRVLVEPGSTAREEIPVERTGTAAGRYRALTTPGLAQGFAADDVVEVDDEGIVTVVERAGNVGVQFLAAQHDHKAVIALVDEAERLGGWLDASTRSVVAISIPARAGFSVIEALAHGYLERAGAGVEWFYANVYQEDGETPLGWWLTTL